jgi:vitamin B12 transporter
VHLPSRSCRARRPAVLLCLPFVFASAALPVAAQPTVVVTGTREALAPDRLVGDLQVIDGERIRTSTADSVEDLLRREAGLQLSRSGGPGANAGLFIRGAGSGNTLVLIDGVRIGAATAGLPELEALSLSVIDRIEVLRGPGSSLYGADAVGGVVQIFTRRGSGPAQWTGYAAAGGYGGREGALAAQGQWGSVDVAASVGFERNTGVSALRPGDAFGNYNPDRDGFSRRSAQAQVGLRPAEGHRVSLLVMDALLKSRYDGSDFLPPLYEQDSSGDFRSRTALQTTSVRHDARWSAAWRSQLTLSRQRSDLVSGAGAPDHFRTDRLALDGQLTWQAAPQQSLTVALSRMQEDAASSSYAADVGRDNNALALAYVGGFGPLSAQAEWRRDDNSVYGAVDTGRAGLAWALGGGLRLRGLVGTTFRAPSFNDLVFPGYGVSTIGPERGRSAELGLEWRSPGADMALVVHRNRVRDLIGYEGDRAFCPADPAYDFGCARNIGRAQLQGASLSGGWQTGAFTLRGSGEWLDAKDRDTGQRLARRAAHQQTLSLRWQGGAWAAGMQALRVGARPEGGQTLAAYTTVDLTASLALAPRWRVEARLLNATNRDVEPARDYQALGRQAWIGLRLDSVGL